MPFAAVRATRAAAAVLQESRRRALNRSAGAARCRLNALIKRNHSRGLAVRWQQRPASSESGSSNAAWGKR